MVAQVVSLTMLAGWQEGHAACKECCTSNSKRLFLERPWGGGGQGLAWSNVQKKWLAKQKPKVIVNSTGYLTFTR